MLRCQKKSGIYVDSKGPREGSKNKHTHTHMQIKIYLETIRNHLDFILSNIREVLSRTPQFEFVKQVLKNI